MDVIYTIDTGASCSLIASSVYDQLPINEQPILREVNIRITGANGSYLHCLGQGDFTLQLGILEINKPLIVADITDEVLLGADVMINKEDQADILLSQGIMVMYGIQIPLRSKMVLINRKVHLSRDFKIPSMTEVVEDAYLDNQECTEKNWIIEPEPQLAERCSVMLASTLVEVDKNKTIKVRLMNPFPKDIELRRDMVIGVACPVDEIKEFIDTENDNENNNMETIRLIKLGNNTSDNISIRTIGSETLENGSDIPDHLQSLFKETSQDKTLVEIEQLKNLLINNQEVFSKSDTDLGLTNITEHCIETENSRPIKQRPRPVPLAFADEDKKAVQKLLEQGSVRPSISPWASPMVFVRKKNGQVRPCIDYRKLNFVTRKDAFPLPRTQDCLDTVAGAKLFSSLDITSAYNQIPVREEDIPKTAFVTKYGLYEYTTMPFGLCNAPATFQRAMEIALAGLQWTTCLIYLDDVLIFSDNFDQQINRIQQVLDRIKLAGLKLKPSKCHLIRNQVTFLGHVLTPRGIKPNPENIEKILKWEHPTTVKEIQSLLGMTNYYRRFIEGYSALVRPLIDLTKKGVKFKWSIDCTKAFDKVRSLLVNAPILAHAMDTGDYILDTDACDTSIGAVLSQLQDNEHRVIAYGSKSLNKTERNYCVTDRELLAVRYFTEYYRTYLLGRKFLLRTDHQAIKWLFTMKEPKSRISRWIEALSEFNFEIEHRSGLKHTNADAMSRCPNPWDCSCKDFEKLRCGPCKKCVRKNELMIGQLPGETDDITQDSGGSHTIKIVKSDLRSRWPAKTTPDKLAKMQQEDPDIGPVYRWLQTNNKPDKIKLSLKSPATRHYVLLWDSLKFEQNILHREYHKKDNTDDYLQIIIPRILKTDILKEMHDSLLSGHLGIKKTYSKTMQRFYWFELKVDVDVYIKKCDICSSIKAPAKHVRGPLGEMRCGSPWDRLSTDILGPLPISERGNKYIMVVTDYFSKWVEIFAIPDQQAETCANLLLNEVVARYGCSYDLHTDQGRNYTGQIFKELCQLLGIRKTQTTPYHASGNGQVERFNATLITMIKSYIKGEQKNWDLNLGCLAGAYRASVHEATGFTPNFLLMGREVRLPADVCYKPPETETKSYGQYITKIRERMITSHDLARQHLETSSKKQKTYYDAKSTLLKYDRGKLVWYASIASEIHITPKLRKRYMGPALVLKKYDDLTYLIQVNRDSKKVVHHDKLMPYNGDKRPRWMKSALK